MPKSFLLDPQGVEQRLQRRFQNNQKKWLVGEGKWPIELALGIPTEKQAAENLREVQAWQSAWRRWQGQGDIHWTTRKWPQLGTQELPQKLSLHSPLQVAHWVGEDLRWQTVSERFALFIERWPQLTAVLPKYFNTLADYTHADVQRIYSVLQFLENNHNSNLYIRQLPIEGVDSKWIAGRKAMVGELFSILLDRQDNTDFYRLTGIRKEPIRIRVRLLDNKLRNLCGGLSDISAPIEEVAAMQIPVKRIFIVENLQTGLAFGDLPDAMVFMKLGYAVDLLGNIPWLHNLPCFYWGDLDTHGFAILNRLRSVLPEAKSVLMDEHTLLAHKNLWVKEKKPVETAEMPILTEQERGVFNKLRRNRWGNNIRLEQERIMWDYAWNRITSVDLQF